MTDCEGVSSSTNSITAAEVEKAPDSPDKATSLELLKAQSYEQNIKERKKYAHRIFLLICFWLAGFSCSSSPMAKVDSLTFRFQKVLCSQSSEHNPKRPRDFRYRHPLSVPSAG